MAPHPEITFVEFRNNSWNKWPVVFPPYGPDPWKLPPQPINLERKSPGCLTLQFAARWLFQLLDIPGPGHDGVLFITELVLKLASTTGDCSGKPDSEISVLLYEVSTILQKVLDNIGARAPPLPVPCSRSRANAAVILGHGKAQSCDIDNDTLRHICWIAQMGLATLKGLLRDKPTVWEDLDHWDFLHWLLSNGFPSQLSHIPPVESVYISAFSWVNGNMSNPDYAAGAALQTVLLTGGDYFGQWAYAARFL